MAGPVYGLSMNKPVDIPVLLVERDGDIAVLVLNRPQPRNSLSEALLKALSAALRPWRERYPDVAVVEHVEMGSAGQVLLSVAARAQLMVVGRRAHRTAVGARIGSVAHGVLHHADCPVAVVPHA